MTCVAMRGARPARRALGGRAAPAGAEDLPDRVEELGLTVPFRPAHRAALDHELAIDV